MAGGLILPFEGAVYSNATPHTWSIGNVQVQPFPNLSSAGMFY